MKKILFTLLAVSLSIVGYQTFGTYNDESTYLETTLELPEEEYINDIPFDTKEVVDSLNQS